MLFIKSISIPSVHRENVYLNLEDFMFLQELVWLGSILIEFTDLGVPCDDIVENNWSNALNVNDRGPEDSYFK